MIKTSNIEKLTHCTIQTDVAYVYSLHQRAKKIYKATCAAFATLHPKAYRPTPTPWVFIQNLDDNKYTALVSFYDAKSATDCSAGNLIMRMRFRNSIGWELQTWDQFEQMVIKFVDYDTDPEMTKTAVTLIKTVLNARC